MKEPPGVLEIFHIYPSGIHTNAYVCKNSYTIYACYTSIKNFEKHLREDMCSF